MSNQPPVPYPPFGLSEQEWEAILARAGRLSPEALRRVCERCEIRFDESQLVDEYLLVLDEAPSLQQLLECIEREERAEGDNGLGGRAA